MLFCVLFCSSSLHFFSCFSPLFRVIRQVFSIPQLFLFVPFSSIVGRQKSFFDPSVVSADHSFWCPFLPTLTISSPFGKSTISIQSGLIRISILCSGKCFNNFALIVSSPFFHTPRISSGSFLPLAFTCTKLLKSYFDAFFSFSSLLFFPVCNTFRPLFFPALLFSS